MSGVPKASPAYPEGGKEHLPHPDSFVPTANTPSDKIVSPVAGTGVDHGMNDNLEEIAIHQGPQHRYAGDLEGSSIRKDKKS